ncbi:MAG: phosphoglycerate kinase, partial [Pseudomonadota bacterium]
MSWKTLDDMDLDGKRVLVRVDLNVPVENGQITDTTRIDRMVPTVSDILAKGGKPVLISHFGRPKGKVVPEMSLRFTVPAVSAALGRNVQFSEEYENHEGEVILLENVRFHPGEERNDPALATQLAKLGDVYCNDAFSAAHRAHASTEAIAHLLPACIRRPAQA